MTETAAHAPQMTPEQIARWNKRLAEDGRRAADITRELGQGPADAMAMLLFSCVWKVPLDRGGAFADRYFWELQENIVDNLERSARAVGAKIVWDGEGLR